MHACEACKCAHHGGGAARNWEHEGLHSGYVGSCPCACMRAYVHGEHAGTAWSLLSIHLAPQPSKSRDAHEQQKKLPAPACSDQCWGLSGSRTAVKHTNTHIHPNLAPSCTQPATTHSLCSWNSSLYLFERTPKALGTLPPSSPSPRRLLRAAPVPARPQLRHGEGHRDVAEQRGVQEAV